MPWYEEGTMGLISKISKQLLFHVLYAISAWTAQWPM